MKRIPTLFIQFFEIFTWSKSFRQNPFIGSPTLNLLGLHVLRMIIAHALYNLRLLLLSPLANSEDRKAFRTKGYLIKHNFLPEDEFDALKHELTSFKGNVREVIEGDTLTQRVLLSSATLTFLPVCQGLIKNSPLSKLLRYTSSKNRLPLYHAENIIQRPTVNNEHDPQQHIHSDTFHPCMKAWLFVDDVTAENGPFSYVEHSQQLSWKRLKWEYQESLYASRNRKKPMGDRYWDGSLRISESELNALGLTKPKQIIVSANTLVIANTHGFHCRGTATKTSSRLAIWMQSRDNPFNPLFSPLPQLTARIFEKIWLPLSLKNDISLVKNGQLKYKDGGFDVKNTSESQSSNN